MIRIALKMHNPNDGCAWYRATGPLGALQRGGQFSVHSIDYASPSMAQLSELAFFQRPMTFEDVDAIRLFRSCGVPVVVDYDDDLLGVPADNPVYSLYANPDTRAAIYSSMEQADAIIVSTDELNRKVSAMFGSKRIYTVRNALDDRVHVDRVREPKEKGVLWRGTSSHQGDLFAFRDQLIRAMETRAFIFYGYRPWFLASSFLFEHYPAVASVPDYLAGIRRLAAPIGIVPLPDTPFNRCKSNIAWLEMAWAGAVCLVPHWTEWEQPGAVFYRNEEDFLDQFRWLIAQPEESLVELRNMAWLAIQEKFMLSKVNPMRERILLAAAGKCPWP